MIIFQGELWELNLYFQFPLASNKIKTNTTNTENDAFLIPGSELTHFATESGDYFCNNHIN